MEHPHILEGTWEEIKQHEEELSGRWLRVIIAQNEAESHHTTHEAVATKQQAINPSKQLHGRGIFKGKSGGTEALLQQKREEILHEAPAKRTSALGKYAFVPGGSEEFAREKQAEIDREDKTRL